MPKVRERISRAQQRFLRGPRFDVRRRGPRRFFPLETPPVTIDGKLLTVPESIIYHALNRLHIPFQAQVAIGGGSRLGGGLADFYLPTYNVYIEYQGPFHKTSEGAARDFYRTVTRKASGAKDIIPIYFEDLDNIHKRLLELIGQPSVSAAVRRAY